MSETTVEKMQELYGNAVFRLFQKNPYPQPCGNLYIFTEVPKENCDWTKQPIEVLRQQKVIEPPPLHLVANAVCSACQSLISCQAVEK